MHRGSSTGHLQLAWRQHKHLVSHQLLKAFPMPPSASLTSFLQKVCRPPTHGRGIKSGSSPCHGSAILYQGPWTFASLFCVARYFSSVRQLSLWNPSPAEYKPSNSRTRIFNCDQFSFFSPICARFVAQAQTSHPSGTETGSIPRRLQLMGRFCWKCNEKRVIAPGICANQSCGALQPPPHNRGPYEVFGLPRTFDISLVELGRIFKTLQRQLHPDKYSIRSKEEQGYSADHASEVNRAYTTLKDPLERAKYLLSVAGFEASGEKTISDPAFLAEMLERREAIQEASGNRQALAAIAKQIIAEREQLLRDLSQAFKEKSYPRAEELTIQLSYNSSALEDVQARL